MRAVQITEFGDPDRLAIADVADPRPGPGQVLIRVAAASVNRADLLVRSGRYHTLPPLPTVPGAEAAGVVEAVGADVSGVDVGDRVLAWGSTGCYAELVATDAAKVVPVPADVSMPVAAALPIAWLTARYCVRELGRVRPGQVVLVHAAASGVGTAAVQTARADGAEVIGVVGSPDKEALAKELGAAHVLRRDRDDVLAEVRRITDGAGADVVLDLAGGETFALSLHTVAAGGRVVALANVAGASSVVDTRDFYPKNVSIHGFQFTNLQRLGWDPRPDLRLLLGEVAEGRFTVPIDTAFPLEEAATAHRRLESDRSRGKVVLTVDSTQVAGEEPR